MVKEREGKISLKAVEIGKRARHPSCCTVIYLSMEVQRPPPLAP